MSKVDIECRELLRILNFCISHYCKDNCLLLVHDEKQAVIFTIVPYANHMFYDYKIIVATHHLYDYHAVALLVFLLIKNLNLSVVD